MKRLGGRGRGSVRERISREMHKRAKEAQRLARAAAPKRSGGLKRSIRADVVRNTAISLWSDAPHAGVVEFGGRARNVIFRPRYYARDAQDKAMRTFDREMLRHIDRGLRG